MNNIKIYNSKGMICYQTLNIKQPDYTIDMSSYVNGIYTISAVINNQVFTQKIILEK